jgi:HlyD family secretion protein
MTDTTAPPRSRWKLWAGVFVVLLTGALAVRWWMGPQVAVHTVQRRDLVQTVVASGRVEAPHRVAIGAQITGVVVRIPVAEGQFVKAGEMLVELESSEQQAIVRQAEAALLLAEVRLRQLLEVQTPVAVQALRQAQSSLDNARASLRRQQDLFDQGFVGAAALDDSRKAFELAEAQHRTAQKQLDTLGPSGSDHALALAALTQARAAVEAAHARAGYALIRAPVAGTLIGRDVETGDVVQAGKLLMTLSPAGATQIVAEIDERNLRVLALGQKALASADAYPQARFAAELVYINPAINAQTGAVEVKLDVPSPPPVLSQDMTVSVDIDVARRPHALVLPVDALRDVESPDATTATVLGFDNGRAVSRSVRLGLRSGGWVEVLDGLRAGDRVIAAAAAASASVASGMRVRAAAAAAAP